MYMNWKIFAVACASVFFVSFPQNIIGCGPGIDPYDYYTSFFQNDLGNDKALQPFYYTGFSFLYDEEEPTSREDVLVIEWLNYTKVQNKKDAMDFIINYSHKDLSTLYYHLEKNKPLSVPDSVKRNEMTKYFMASKDFETLGYIMYAKKVEPFVTSYYNNWDATPVDSLKMHKQLLSGIQLYNASKTDFIKLKYGYQIMRLAFYNNEAADAILYYDKYIATNKTSSVLQELSLAMKAGALYRTGKEAQAAYLYSKVFASTDVKKISNYTSFKWANGTNDKILEDAMSFCTSNKEKANLLALASLGKTGNVLSSLQNTLSIDAKNELLKTLVVREINKLEETLLTPSISTEAGGKAFYFTWNDMNSDSAFASQKDYAKKVVSFLEEASNKVVSNDKGFYYISAAYVSYMRRDLKEAKDFLALAKKQDLRQREKDQWQLTDLLVKVNETEKIDPAFEESILPSVKWMYEKAEKEKAKAINYYEYKQWKNFYRNFFTEVMAKKYHKQKDFIKETLSVGAADMPSEEVQDGEYSFGNGINFLHDNLQSADVNLLYGLMTLDKKTKFDDFLLSHNSIKEKDVIDFAGTAYLRDYDYQQAINWFSKSSAKNSQKKIEKNPFIDLLYDREERLSNEKITTSKLDFAKEMLRLENLIKTDAANADKYYYKIALGMYNMTYYGHAWELVAYYRSGSDGYSIPKDANTFQKEYYGCFKAHDYFKKAVDVSSNKEFKARALFMMAKCSQKLEQQPGYGDPYDYDTYTNNMKNYMIGFKNNKYFPEFTKIYRQTAFYNEAFNTCSYLRDFVSANK